MTIDIRELSVGFQQRTVLDRVSLTIPDRGVLGLLGPGGVGKTTLLRTLARWNEALPSFWCSGRVLLDGQSLFEDIDRDEAQRQVPMHAQKASLYTATVLDNAIDGVRPREPLAYSDRRELGRRVLADMGMWEEYESLLDDPILSLSIGQQRRLSLARLCAGGVRCLLVDEPLRDLDEAEEAAMRDMIRARAERHAVVVVTHNQRAAKALCSEVCLMTAGRVVEVTPVDQFYRAPQTELGAEYVASGNCWPKTPPPEVAAPQPRPAGAGKPQPTGFHWILPGLLGGTQRPGLLGDEDEDLHALAGLGCHALVTLTEQPYTHELLRVGRIRTVHFPIVDMSVPKLANALLLCEQVCEWIDQELPTVLHCKAGLGRTGTMLACVLVLRGETAVSAIGRVRAVNPYYIQSGEQLSFVSVFSDYIADAARASRVARKVSL